MKYKSENDNAIVMIPFCFNRLILEPPTYKLHDVYRAFSVLASEINFVQSEIYKNSFFLGNRMEQISYYNCTNYYFEIEQEDGDRIPLAFSLLLDCDKFIYCSDAGLASKDNFALNPTEQRAFIASEDQTCR